MMLYKLAHGKEKRDKEDLMLRELMASIIRPRLE